MVIVSLGGLSYVSGGRHSHAVATPPCAGSPGVRVGELGKGQGVKREVLREEKIVLVLSCKLGGV